MANSSRTILFMLILCCFMGCSARIASITLQCPPVAGTNYPEDRACSNDGKSYNNIRELEADFCLGKNKGLQMLGECPPVPGDDGSDCFKHMCGKDKIHVCKASKEPSKQWFRNSCFFRAARCHALHMNKTDDTWDQICTTCPEDEPPTHCEDIEKPPHVF